VYEYEYEYVYVYVDGPAGARAVPPVRTCLPAPSVPDSPFLILYS
jgi:hypothetical protein